MNDILIIVTQIVETPGMAFRISMMVATAMIIGFVIVDNYHVLIKVMLTLSVLIIFQEWMRYALIASTASQTHPTSLAIYTTIIAVMLFAIGIGVGSSIGISARRRERNIQRAGDEIIHQIDNGGVRKTA